MRKNFVYTFDKQRMFRPGYMAKNTGSSRVHKKYYENNMNKEGSLLVKGK